MSKSRPPLMSPQQDSIPGHHFPYHPNSLLLEDASERHQVAAEEFTTAGSLSQRKMNSTRGEESTNERTTAAGNLAGIGLVPSLAASLGDEENEKVNTTTRPGKILFSAPSETINGNHNATSILRDNIDSNSLENNDTVAVAEASSHHQQSSTALEFSPKRSRKRRKFFSRNHHHTGNQSARKAAASHHTTTVEKMVWNNNEKNAGEENLDSVQQSHQDAEHNIKKKPWLSTQISGEELSKRKAQKHRKLETLNTAKSPQQQRNWKSLHATRRRSSLSLIHSGISDLNQAADASPQKPSAMEQKHSPHSSSMRSLSTSSSVLQQHSARTFSNRHQNSRYTEYPKSPSQQIHSKRARKYSSPSVDKIAEPSLLQYAKAGANAGDGATFQNFLSSIEKIKRSSDLTVLYSHFQLSYSQSEFSESEFHSLIHEVEAILRKEEEQQQNNHTASSPLAALQKDLSSDVSPAKSKRKSKKLDRKEKKRLKKEAKNKRNSIGVSHSPANAHDASSIIQNLLSTSTSQQYQASMSHSSHSSNIIFTNSWILDAFDILDRKDMCAVSMESLFLLICFMIGRHKLFLGDVWVQFGNAIWELLKDNSTESMINIRRARSVAHLARVDDWLVTQTIWEKSWFQHHNQDMLNNQSFIDRDMFISLYESIFQIIDEGEDMPVSLDDILMAEIRDGADERGLGGGSSLFAQHSGSLAGASAADILKSFSVGGSPSQHKRLSGESNHSGSKLDLSNPASKYATDLTYPFNEETGAPDVSVDETPFPTVDSKTIIRSRDSIKRERQEQVKNLFRRRKMETPGGGHVADLDSAQQSKNKRACCTIM